MSVFSERLRQLRIDRNVTQLQLAKGIGTTDRACRRYESGENEPTLSVINAIAGYFDVSVDYLMGRDNHWIDSKGHINVKIISDIYNLDIDELKKKLKQD